jgi:hypothetical protein
MLGQSYADRGHTILPVHVGRSRKFSNSITANHIMYMRTDGLYPAAVVATLA